MQRVQNSASDLIHFESGFENLKPKKLISGNNMKIYYTGSLEPDLKSYILKRINFEVGKAKNISYLDMGCTEVTLVIRRSNRAKRGQMSIFYKYLSLD